MFALYSRRIVTVPLPNLWRVYILVSHTGDRDSDKGSTFTRSSCWSQYTKHLSERNHRTETEDRQIRPHWYRMALQDMTARPQASFRISSLPRVSNDVKRPNQSISNWKNILMPPIWASLMASSLDSDLFIIAASMGRGQWARLYRWAPNSPHSLERGIAGIAKTLVKVKRIIAKNTFMVSMRGIDVSRCVAYFYLEGLYIGYKWIIYGAPISLQCHHSRIAVYTKGSWV